MNDLKFYLVKIAVIILVGNLYFFFGSLLSYLIYKYFTNHKPILENTFFGKFKVLAHLIFEISMLLVCVYLIRKTVKKMLKPLNNIQGFDIYKVKEMNGSIILAFAFLMFLKPTIVEKTKFLLSNF